jgi:uncharacterized protein YdhG (YjbR/CyaY superfamily)
MLRVVARAPEAEETFQYKMPTYTYRGRSLCAFASQKRYISFYVHTGILEVHRAAFKGLNLGRGCVRFRRLEQFPLDETVARLDEEAQGSGG